METPASCQGELALAGSTLARIPVAEKDRGQVGELWDRVLSPANLAEAWRRVRQNGGAAGIDHRSVAVFPAFYRAHWTKVRAKLQAGTYVPSPVRRTFIPKKDGGERPLGIPTVLDRVIQQALAQELSGVFEVEFSEHSYAYRAGRNAHDALRAVRSAAAAGQTEAVDCDLKGFFDHVDHDLLMARVAAKVRDKRVLHLIGRYLRAGVVLPDGTREPTPRGVPQGGPLSPLLANIMLTPLDRELERRGRRFARYADDFLILVQSRDEAERAMTEVVRFVEGKLKLMVNPVKSRVAPLAQCTFLGCRVTRTKIRWSAAAVEEFREKVRELTKRTWGVSMERRLGSLNRYVQGWFGYYRISRTWGEVLELAVQRRGGRCAPGLLLHSDRGVQYASERFRAQLAAHGITASMSRRGNCYDNARAESFFSTLKIEHTYRHRFADHHAARQSTFEWIEAFYNLHRRHSSIGYLSPVDFENKTN